MQAPLPTQVQELLGAVTVRQFHDRLFQWWSTVPLLFGQIIAIVDPVLAACFYFAGGRRLNRVFIGEDLQRSEADVLYSVPFQAARRQRGDLLLEHQGDTDAWMGFRFHHYRDETWQAVRTRLGKYAALGFFACVLIYTGWDPWSGPRPIVELAALPDVVRALLADYLPAWRIAYLDLRRCPAALLRAAGTAGGWALRMLQADGEPDADRFAAVFREVAEGLAVLPAQQSAACRCVLWSLWAMAVRRNPTEYGKLEAILLECVGRSRISRRRVEVVQMGRMMLDVWKEQGLAEGLAEGLARGMAQGMAQGIAGQQALVLRAVGIRFGQVAGETEALIRTLAEPEPLEEALTAAMLCADETALTARLRSLSNGHSA